MRPSPETLRMMADNLARRAEQHAGLGDDRGAEIYRRLAADCRGEKLLPNPLNPNL